MEFKALPLHDSELTHIAYDFFNKTVILKGLLCSNIETEFTILFTDVSLLNISREEPWGPSNSINESIGGTTGNFILEVQSGDTISVVAASFVFDRTST